MPSFCQDKIWYALSTEWYSQPRHFSTETPFQDDFSKVSNYDLTDQDGVHMNPSWFGLTQKKAMVLVLSHFGIMASTIWAKNPNEEKAMSSVRFKTVKEITNSLLITAKMAGKSQFLTSFPETPPLTPSPGSSPAEANGSSSVGKVTGIARLLLRDYIHVSIRIVLVLTYNSFSGSP